MNTPYFSSSEAKKIEAISKSEKEMHIASWFEGTDYPIENPEEIKDILVDGDMILFWYHGENYSCLVEPRN